jgi:protoporphyrinogen oxidase
MPVKDLINIIEPSVPIEIKNIANGLVYRDFIAVGVLIDKFKGNKKLDDNWIYIQEKDVKVGRMQIFNNWSPFLVGDSQKYWLGLEYFCQEGDGLWSLSDDEILKVAIGELIKLDFIDESNFMDGTVLKVPKTYPAYFGSYKDFGKIVEYLDNFENLFLVGRNGMHKYNNQDHSMLTSMQVVQNIKDGIVDKSNIWSINTEMDYHEEK